MPSYTTKANLDHLYTKIRDVQTDNTTFRRYAKRLMTVVCEEALSYVSPKQCVVKTPVDDYEYGNRLGLREYDRCVDHPGSRQHARLLL